MATMRIMNSHVEEAFVAFQKTAIAANIPSAAEWKLEIGYRSVLRAYRVQSKTRLPFDSTLGYGTREVFEKLHAMRIGMEMALDNQTSYVSLGIGF